MLLLAVSSANVQSLKRFHLIPCFPLVVYLVIFIRFEVVLAIGFLFLSLVVVRKRHTLLLSSLRYLCLEVRERCSVVLSNSGWSVVRSRDSMWGLLLLEDGLQWQGDTSGLN